MKMRKNITQELSENFDRKKIKSPDPRGFRGFIFLKFKNNSETKSVFQTSNWCKTKNAGRQER